MLEIESLKNIFSESNDNYFFNSVSYKTARKSLLYGLYNNINLNFLLGISGSGKTNLLLHLSKELDCMVVYTNSSFRTEREFNEFLYYNIQNSYKGLENMPNEVLKDIVLKKYKDIEHVIILDEAQVIDSRVLEYIRILADSKNFMFILSVEIDFGKNILKNSSFSSSTKNIVILEILDLNEFKKYVEEVLLLTNNMNFLDAFSKYLPRIYKYSGGSFRHAKRMLFIITDLMKHYSKKGALIINKKVVDMAALECGLY